MEIEPVTARGRRPKWRMAGRGDGGRRKRGEEEETYSRNTPIN